MTCFVGCCEKIIVADENLLLIHRLFFFIWNGLVWGFVCIDSDSGESQSLSYIDFSLFVYSFLVYLPEVGYFKSQSLSMFLLCQNKTIQTTPPPTKQKNPTANKKPRFSSLPIKEMHSERQQTAAPWDFVLAQQLINPYIPTKAQQTSPASMCRKLRNAGAGAPDTAGESGQGAAGFWEVVEYRKLDLKLQETKLY